MRAIYPGSFDPITLGHLDIIKRTLGIFEELTVLIANAENKKYLFSPQERKQMTQECLKKVKGVTVDLWDGLTVEYLRKQKVNVIVRGLRGFSDFDNEWVIAQTNKSLYPEVETVFVISTLEHSTIASRIVKEIALNDGPLEGLVPPSVILKLKNKFKKR